MFSKGWIAPKGARKGKDLQLAVHAFACRLAARTNARSAPLRDKIREVGRGLSLESTVLGGSANEKEEEKYQKLVKNNCSLPRTVSR